MAKMKDQYPQFMYLNVTMSAANALTFSEVSLGLNLFDYAGLIISRIEYYPSRASLNQINASTDQLRVALVGSNSIEDLAQDQPQVYDLMALTGIDVGSPADFEIVETPIVHDFTGFAGGGVLVPAQNVYIAADSDGFGIAGVASMRVYFRVLQLAAGDFVELVQRLRVLST